MSQKGSRFDAAVETFANHGGLTEREAQVYVLRELQGVRRGLAADRLDVDESTVDTLHQRAKDKATLPNIDAINRQSATNTGMEEGEAIEIRFENGAMLRYVYNVEVEKIQEQTATANDPRSIYRSYDLGGDEDELADYAITTLEEFTRSYRDDPEACRSDWTPVFEAITGYGA